MFNWLRKLWHSRHHQAQKHSATLTTYSSGNNRSSIPETTTASSDVPPVHSQSQNPILVRGKLWKNTAETQWELPLEPETSSDLSIEDLIKQLARVDRTEIRRAAAKRLGQFGSNAKSAIPALINATIDIDHEVRESALNALNAIDPDWPQNAEAQSSFPTLAMALKSPFLDVKNTAFHLLQVIGPPVVPALVNTLCNEDDPVERVYVIQTLARIGPEAASAIPGLIQALGSRFLQTRIAAAKALANIGAAAVESAVPALVAGLSDPFAGGRTAMATCLSHAGPAAELGIPAILPLLSDREAQVRKAAAITLKQIGPKTIPALLKILQARDIRQLKTWNEAMFEEWHKTKPSHSIITPDYLNVLRNLSWAAYHVIEEQESLEVAHESALNILAEFGVVAKTAVTTVTKLLADPNPNIQLAAIKTLGQIGGQAKCTISELVPLLVDDNESIRKEAAKSLKSIDCDWSLNPVASSAIADLTRRLSNAGKPGEVAAQTLAMIGVAAVPALINTLEFGTRVAQENAATALGNIGKGAESAVPALKRAIQESHPWVQDKAVKALAKIDDDHTTGEK